MKQCAAVTDAVGGALRHRRQHRRDHFADRRRQQFGIGGIGGEFEQRRGIELQLALQGFVHLRATDRPPSFEPIDLTLDADVVLGAVAVAGDSGVDDFPAPDEARALAARLLELDDYEPPGIEGCCTVLRPRCGDGA